MSLALQVATRNKVNSKANYVRKYLQDFLQDYIGKKIIKVTPYKTFTAKIKDQLADFDDRLIEQKYRLVVSFFDHNVYAQIDTTYAVSEYGVNYVKQEFYVCSVENCILTEIRECETFRADYTEQEITDKRAQIAELDRQISALTGEMNRFEKGY